MERKEERNRYFKDAVAKIAGKGRRQELAGTVFPRGLWRIVFCDVCSGPYNVTFLPNKRAFAPLKLL